MSIELVMSSNCLILCRPLLLLPSVFPSIRVFSSELALLITWVKYWSISFNISLSNEYSGLISYRIDWLDLAVQRILKSLLQYHNSKASILQRSALFRVQILYPYMTTGKIIVLTIVIFVSKVTSLLSNTLSRFVRAFFPRNKRLLNFLPTVTICSDFGAQENKICHCLHFFPFYLPWSVGARCHYLSFFNVKFQAKFFTLIRSSLVPLHFLSLEYHLHIWGCW